jgi:hypothetical protein
MELELMYSLLDRRRLARRNLLRWNNTSAAQKIDELSYIRAITRENLYTTAA